MARETREAWARRVGRWQRSGLTAERFAAQEGVNPRTLTFWKWKLGREGRGHGRDERVALSDQRVAFVELLSAGTAPAETSTTPPPTFEVLLPGGYRVRVAPGFERAALGELLDVLAARR